MIKSSLDIVNKLVSSAVISVASEVFIAKGKPAFNANASGTKIYVNEYPSVDEVSATWLVWIIDYDNNPVDVILAEIKRILPAVNILVNDIFIEISTTEVLVENTVTGPPPPPVEQQIEDKISENLNQKFNKLVQDIADRMLLVKSGSPGRDGIDGLNGRDGRDGVDGKDGKDGQDLVATDAKLDDLKDVEVEDPEKGQVLMFSGDAWRARYVPISMGGAGGRSDGDIRDLTGQTWTREPMGHEDRTETIIDFNSTTRTFTISPIGESFHVWCVGTRYTFTEPQFVTIPDVSGLYYIYFKDGVLEAKTAYFDFKNEAPTAYVYWNAALDQLIYFGDERHGITLDWQTHEYLHRTRGAKIASGFGASNYTLLGNGSVDSDAYISLSGGTFFDEDMKITVVHSDTPVANSFQQDIQGPGKFPVFYRSNNEWLIDAATNFAIKAGTIHPQYNQLLGGIWSTVTADTNKYIISFLVATNHINTPVLALLGQNQYVNIADAQAVKFTSLDVEDFPSLEFVPLYKLIFKATGSNAIGAYLVDLQDIRSVPGDAITISTQEIQQRLELIEARLTALENP